MPKYNVKFAINCLSVEADSSQEAEEKAWELLNKGWTERVYSRVIEESE